MSAPKITPAWLAQQLRNASAWLSLAAKDLDQGDLEQARKKAWIGTWACRPIPVEISDLMKEPAKV